MFSIDRMAHLWLLTNYIQLILSSIFPLAFEKNKFNSDCNRYFVCIQIEIW